MAETVHPFAPGRHGNRPQHALPSGAPGQLTLQFEPGLADRHATLREFLAYRVQVQGKPAKAIAADMDMSPSTLSRKLAPGEADTQRFNCDDLETYIASQGDTSPIEYLVAKYLQSDSSRAAAQITELRGMIERVQSVLTSLEART